MNNIVQAYPFNNQAKPLRVEYRVNVEKKILIEY
jgi:hypothetical protein